MAIQLNAIRSDSLSCVECALVRAARGYTRGENRVSTARERNRQESIVFYECASRYADSYACATSLLPAMNGAF